MANYLVTGGGGFIGSHFIAHLLGKYPDARVLNLDLLTYAAHPKTLEYLSELAPDRYEFIRKDITDPTIGELLESKKIDYVVNFAAESHVDRSILDPGAFVRTNVTGTLNLLTLAREKPNLRFLQVSTDEVYGSLFPNDPAFTESSPLDPSSPYAASKASADLLVLANFRTFGQDVVLTRCSNNFGPFQFPEKLIPLVIANAIEDSPIPVYGDGRQIRDWIYVEDHCEGIDLALHQGQSGRAYNIGGREEHENIEIICTLLDILEKPHSLISFVKDRPGHDRRYGIDSSRIRNELSWKPQKSFRTALEKTVQWYLSERSWWEELRGKDYKQYYENNYRSKMSEWQEMSK